ncbi:uncharacterized protein LOC123694824 [Colias croceus]|uniref:uncharacterized protein LOC123694824 n=1 Tax=Colias crocea TaxID=72248 RepID=UPI001E27FE64|nr:uncharacterized protein LOC123694824 [Colias croceus]
MIIILLFFLLLFIIYAYINHNGEFTATASAIRQIWSGSCRLGCRQSEYSSFSGLSGLQGPGTSTQGPYASQRSSHRHNFCVCDTCPCALIENFLSTCRPVTSMYTGVLEVVSGYYYSFIQTLSNVFENFSQVSTCGMSCQRQAQLLCSKHLDSSQNITFGEQTSAKKSESRMKFMKSILQRQKSNCTEERMETIEDNDNLRNRENDSISNIIESPGSSAHRKQCSKCIEQGFTCMKHCPKAKKM